MKFKISQKAMAELLVGPEMRQAVSDKTAQVGRALAAQIGAENVSTHVAGISRARGYVWREQHGSLRREAKDGALDKALRSARDG